MQIARKVLVIEDDASVRATILELLELEGLQAISAENGWLGLQLAREEMPDLIISDINLPELDGYGVLQVLRQDPETARIPFIVMTGDPTNLERFREQGLKADDYLIKPVTINSLIEAIAVQLRKRV